MNSQTLHDLLDQLHRGELSVAEVEGQLRGADLTPLGARELTAGTGSAQVDLDRQRRCGYPEVVFSPGKTSAAIADIFRVLQAHGQDCFATRASRDQARDLLALFPDAQYNPIAGTILLRHGEETPPEGDVAVITAGTGDLPVAEEAVETARWMGCQVDLILDVGVAGPHRLLAQKHRFLHADCIVVVAGMEGALPSVVGGHVACPVIAVPTSVGYGASFQGLAALLGMLNSCAANVTPVNIDGGFKGGYLAGLITRGIARARRQRD